MPHALRPGIKTGALIILLCTLCMGMLFAGWAQVGKAIFRTSLVVMALSLVLSIIEIRMSDRALEGHPKHLATFQPENHENTLS
ncbi:MAG: DUF2721 domain-containing protein [Planctomycetota bacterium]|nr:DUF2721 domain-containing protein [Planctomycetota bacterium]